MRVVVGYAVLKRAFKGAGEKGPRTCVKVSRKWPKKIVRGLPPELMSCGIFSIHGNGNRGKGEGRTI